MRQLGEGGAASLERVLALRPDLAALYGQLLDRLWTDTGLDPVVLELCRLRQAGLLGCDAEAARRTSYAVQAGLQEDDRRRAARPGRPTRASGPSSAPASPTRRRSSSTRTASGTTTLPRCATCSARVASSRSTTALGLFDGLCRLHLALEVT